jgi:uncharacterized membrane protein SpoIIM required for sporulation
VIINLPGFLAASRPRWAELERMLDKLESDPAHVLSLHDAKRLHHLYQHASADLAKIMTFASEPEVRRYLETLVARAYAEIHETRKRPHRLAPLHWFFRTFPQTFRRHVGAFWMSVVITVAGCLFGGVAITIDPEAKSVLMPFEHLQGSPSQRVAKEESATEDRLKGGKTSFSSFLMTHNTKVSIMTLAMGITWGLGTIILLFYNGVILGAVALDYVLDGQMKFLLGWLLPHGSVEIPSILIAGQAGLLLGRALIGRGDRASLRLRLRQIGPDLVTLIGGVAVLLVWAGFIEAFLSQYHEPVLPYSVKIAFGCIEICLLSVFLSMSGKQEEGGVP